MMDSEESTQLAKDRLRRVLTSHGADQIAAVKELWDQLDTRAPQWIIAVATSIDSPSLPGQTNTKNAFARRGARTPGTLTVECTFEDHHAFLLAGDSAIDTDTLADLTPCCPMSLVGVGGPAEGPLQLPRSYQQALGALRTATANAFAPGSTTRWSELSPIKVLSLQGPDVLADTVPEEIALLGSESELLETVDHYLDHGRKPDLVADSLHIHRGTLYYRLRKFEDATGLDLESGKDRLTIQLSLEALKLLRAPKWHHAH
jgi:hypothetical protein